MRITFTKYPIDIILCIAWSTLLLPIVLLDKEGIIRIILSLPVIFFVPGYLLVLSLFPLKKNNSNITTIERITLSIGLSIAVVPLIGFILNYTPWGLRLEPILLSIFIFVIGFGIISLLKWYKTMPNERVTLSLNLSLSKSEFKIDKILTIMVIISIILVISLSIYIVMNPQRSKPFTEFYLFGPTLISERADGYIINQTYSTNLTRGLNYSVKLEIDNHEYKTVNYTIDIWLFNQSTNNNLSEYGTVVHNMWFLDKITTTLEHSDIDVEKPVIHQWEYDYSFDFFTMNKTGQFKLVFLLFTNSTANFTKNKDYKNQNTGIENFYRELYLWVEIYDRVPTADFTFIPNQASTTDIISFMDNSIVPYSKITGWQWDFGDGNTSFGETIGLKFDGIDDYVDCGTNISLAPTNGTIEAWIYMKDYMGARRIFTGSFWGSNRRHPNFLVSNNYLVLALANPQKYDGHTYYANFQKDTWYHVAATWNGSNVSFYVNGSLKQTDNQSLIPAGNTDLKRIGALEPYSDVFNGIIRDLRIYNRSLNSTEIQNNYESNVSIDGLVSWWKMNEGGTIAVDSIGTNDGTIYGAYWFNQATHRYNHPGSYNVSLTISNEYGQISSIYKTITIT